eukprot:1878002-Rhodomonas_salina.1
MPKAVKGKPSKQRAEPLAPAGCGDFFLNDDEPLPAHWWGDGSAPLARSERERLVFEHMRQCYYEAKMRRKALAGGAMFLC